MQRDWKLIEIPYHRTDEAADVLARALADDPILATFVPPDLPDRGRVLRLLYRSSCLSRLSGRQPLLGAEWDNMIVGVAIMDSPYKPQDTESVKRSWDAVAAALDTENVRKMQEFVVLRESHRPPRQHHYLATFAVDPRYQDMGFGTALLKCVIEASRNDTSSTGVMLDCRAENVLFYERNGFSQIGKEDFAGVEVHYMYCGVR